MPITYLPGTGNRLINEMSSLINGNGSAAKGQQVDDRRPSRCRRARIVQPDGNIDHASPSRLAGSASLSRSAITGPELHGNDEVLAPLLESSGERETEELIARILEEHAY